MGTLFFKTTLFMESQLTQKKIVTVTHGNNNQQTVSLGKYSSPFFCLFFGIIKGILYEAPPCHKGKCQKWFKIDTNYLKLSKNNESCQNSTGIRARNLPLFAVRFFQLCSIQCNFLQLCDILNDLGEIMYTQQCLVKQFLNTI